MILFRSSVAILTAGLFVACGGSGDTATHGGGVGNGATGAGASSGNDGGANDAGAGASGGASDSGSGAAGGGTGASGGAGNRGGNSGTTGGGGVGGSGATGTGGSVTSVTPVPEANACATDRVQAQDDTLNLFIMEDRSGSMKDATSTGDSKWTVITDALTSFVQDPQSAGIGAGIGFFGNTGNDQSSCTAATYAKPSVGIAPLNGNAAAIVGAIGKITPGGNTPTEPALQGAINYARTWAAAHPTHKVIVIFATDGLPNGCNSSVQGASTVAASGVTGTPPIQTYVIGVFGSQDCPNGLTQQCTVVQNTNSIAKGGGTGSAFIVDTGGNTLQQFEDAMSSIRTANITSCLFTIPKAPTGKTIDPTQATVQYAPVGKTPTNLPWMASAADCGTSAGWYYDNVNKPGKIHLCDSTCKAVQADTQARIEILLGCTNTGGGGGAGGGSGQGGAGGNGGNSGNGGNGGTGGTGTGTGGAGGTSACLLTGQSCQSSSECCAGSCSLTGLCVRNPLIRSTRFVREFPT